MIATMQRETKVELRTVRCWGRLMPDTPNTRLRRILEKADRQERFWHRLEHVIFLRWLR